MKMFLRILIGFAVLIIGLICFIILTWNRQFDAPYPDIHASSDSTVIARGKYLAYGPAHCATCHIPMDKIMAVEDGLEMPLSGGWEVDIPPGVFRAPNLTPDPETGIANVTDGELARIGRFIAPFMPFQELTDEDLTAVISFLRSQPPVRHEVKRSEIKFLGKALMAFGMLDPRGPETAPLKSIKPDTTSQYGAYIAKHMANCLGCHTRTDLKSGKFTGPQFAGGFEFEPDAFSQGYSFISPNLTPDQETGIIAGWDEDAFEMRFRGGRLYEGSPMPWGAFSRMSDRDLKAVYKFLHSLKPVRNTIEKIVFAPGEELPD
jgi:mono/diheme cytochrome c family protein